MVTLDTVVRLPLHVVECGWQELVDRSSQRRGSVRHHLDWFAVRQKRSSEEPSCGADVASGRAVHVNDLAVLVNGPVHVPSPALYIGLVHEPTVTDRMSARLRGIREQWRTALHPPGHGHVIDLDPMLGQQLFDIAVGEPVTEIPPQREDDDLRREPKAGKP